MADMTQAYDVAMTDLMARAVNTPIGSALDDVMAIGSTVSLKRWLSDKASVDTVQVNYRDDGTLYNPWFPGMRTVTTAATYVKFNNSRRDFAGNRCIAATGSHWLGICTDTQAVLLYSISELSGGSE